MNYFQGVKPSCQVTFKSITGKCFGLKPVKGKSWESNGVYAL